MLRVSLNEINRTCQRALEGLGAPVGIDREGAAAVAWLEARGLPGLELLTRDMARLDGGFGPIAQVKTGAGIAELDARGQSAIALAGSVVDFLRSLAEPDKSASLAVVNLLSPLFLLPAAAAARAALGERYQVEWPIGGPPVCSALLNETGATISLAKDGEAVLASELLTRVTLSTASAPNQVSPWAHEILTPALLTGRVQDSLANGVFVSEDVWWAIGAMATRVLVSTTAESRARGAGGGDANA